ncbi:family 16 glycoside hydrolase [Flavobacterium sp.]|uniref:family 16 glycoside hydrolase n=1 Tax=Flavobacterium sp. TaxID=239 RepID=UPI001B4D6485|nr:family 16 glycoside hydrolase [Flavobacterium sp.]MBP6181034.1 hypothetical protein [Flavobacterium sp.]
MKNLKYIFVVCFLIGSKSLSAQKINLNNKTLEPNQVAMSFENLDDKEVLKVVKDTTVQLVDEPTFVRIKDLNFKNGSIEVKVLSRLLKNAPAFARGFIGVAFRIDDKNTKYESIYIRPTNGRVDDQVRRNHSIQYYAYPDFKFDKLRQISPEKYESYADMGLNEWITMRIEVKGKEAQLFLNNSKYPVLIVNDLKLGENTEGGIGLWVEIGTEGYFKDLKITKQ